MAIAGTCSGLRWIFDGGSIVCTFGEMGSRASPVLVAMGRDQFSFGVFRGGGVLPLIPLGGLSVTAVLADEPRDWISVECAPLWIGAL